MDLGATVCLARVPGCEICPLADGGPSWGRRFEPARKQGPFEGSFRQLRAATLRQVAERPLAADELDARALESLLRDGPVEEADRLIRLPARSPAD